jgi:enoyl-[acyl-carrier protein] reductase III
MTLTFQDKSVLVTGGSRGIGKTIALRFAELGAKRIALGYLRNDKAAEETAGELGALGAEVVLVRGDVGKPEKAAAAVEQAGELDIVVSNAASGVIKPALELEEKHWDWTLNANARALFTLARHAAPRMRPGGSIIGISSLGAQRVLKDYVLVGVSKAALEALVRYLAVELAPRDIRVNAVSAGLVETGALEYFPDREEMLRWYKERTPAGRLVEPRDVADAVCFLASPEANMIRGQTLIVDGGYSVLA